MYNEGKWREMEGSTMIQDISPKKMFNQYNPQASAKDSDLVLVFEGRKVLLKKSDNLQLPVVSDFAKNTEFTYLFKIDDCEFYHPAKGFDFAKANVASIEDVLADGTTGGPEFDYMDITDLRENYRLDKHLLFAILTGKHLADWYAINHFCGRCGEAMQHSGTERAMLCPSCKNAVYPRIMPAVIVGVRNGDRLLLTRYRRGYGHNALVAGFVEIGETLEETVAREVMEEAGLKVKNISYYKSQPWGMASDILSGFYCDVDGDDTIRMDEGELKYAAWVERSEIELQPDDASLTNEMMKMFKEGHFCDNQNRPQ